MAAFKCYRVALCDVALPPRSVEFHDTTCWMKSTEEDHENSSCLLHYSAFVSTINTLSKVRFHVFK